MKETKFYKYAIGALILLNLLMLAFFFFRKPRPPHQIAARQFHIQGIEILKLDDAQRSMFTKITAKHNETLTTIIDKQGALLQSYFEYIIKSPSSNQRDSILSTIEQLERSKIEITYQHFEEIKSMLKEDQLPYFEDFMHRALKIILLKNQKNPKPPKDF